jgi:hypothetical protein
MTNSPLHATHARTAVRATLVPALLYAGAAAGGTASPGMCLEKDLLGPKEVPADAYYGVQTVRALENFQISGAKNNQYPGFVEAWVIVKLAAARANVVGEHSSRSPMGITWRLGSESNRRTRLCRPLHDHSAT